jgi:uncharacterized protein (TIGR03435 family)
MVSVRIRGFVPVKQQRSRWIPVLIALSLASAVVLSTESRQVPEWQKAAGSKLSFEVASIKLADPATSTPFIFPLDYSDFFGVANPHGRFVAQVPLAAYIAFAYRLWPAQEIRDAMLAHLPKWADTDQYVINALAAGSPSKDQMRLMTQSLLADRFKLTVHFERQEFSVQALVLDNPGKTGAKLNPHTDGVPCDVSQITSDVFVPLCGHVQAVNRPDNSVLMAGRNLTMNEIAATLSQLTGYFTHPVVDQTGLAGRFDFTLQWTRESNIPGPPDPQGSTMRDALVEQLGLKLKPTKMLMDTVIVDQVERPSEN